MTRPMTRLVPCPHAIALGLALAITLGPALLACERDRRDLTGLAPGASPIGGPRP